MVHQPEVDAVLSRSIIDGVVFGLRDQIDQ